MTDKNAEFCPLLICKGRRTMASYLEQEIASYRGNPFNEALPPILTEDEALEALAYYPPYDESERLMPSHLRLHQIQTALQFFAPLPVHLDLERRFSRMIRASYQSRNPTKQDFWQNVGSAVKTIGPSSKVVPNGARHLPLGFTIIGFPGVGKTTAVEAVLSLYPQVIYHSLYAERDFNFTQLAWLKLGCPPDGSTKGLCINFFQAIDYLLGTNYYKNYASGRRTQDELMPQMARVAAGLGIGVLVIDEIQRLSQAKSGGAEKMLNFFVQLTDSIGVPVVLVGTYKARSVLSGQFHQIRRGTGQGDLVWDRMEEGFWVSPEDETTKPGIWQVFLESLWTYQYVRTPCPLTEELSHVLYEETQGITDFAAKVYMLAQARAISTAAGDVEMITPDIIRSVARDSLRQAQPVLAALRMGDTRALDRYEDVHPINVDHYLKKSLSELGNEETQLVGNQQPSTELPKENEQVSPSNDVAPPKPRKRRSSKRKSETTYTEGDLRAGVAKGVEKGMSAEESLRQAGYIETASEGDGRKEAA